MPAFADVFNLKGCYIFLIRVSHVRAVVTVQYCTNFTSTPL